MVPETMMKGMSSLFFLTMSRAADAENLGIDQSERITSQTWRSRLANMVLARSTRSNSTERQLLRSSCTTNLASVGESSTSNTLRFTGPPVVVDEAGDYDAQRTDRQRSSTRPPPTSGYRAAVMVHPPSPGTRK
jgi:hypothetical protein